jgi:hypothetical protein
MLKAIWTLSNSKLGLLLIGFALTTVIGAIFTDWIQRRSWQYQTELEHMRQDFEWKRSRKFELLQQKLDEGQKSIEDISDLINLRFFRLQKVYESALATNSEVARRSWEEYMETVESWNVKLIINQNKLARLVTDDAARQFNNYETDNPVSNPSSLHGHFFLAHKSVQEVFECAQNHSCSVTADMKEAADERLRSLDYFADAFVDNVSSLFLERTFALEEFRNL